MKNRNSITPEDYEEFISLTLRTRNSTKPSRMLARNWKRQWFPLCLARQVRHVSMGRPVANTMRSNQNLCASWKQVNPQDCEWENHCRLIMRTILQEKDTIQYSITIWFTNLFLLPQAKKIPAAKAAVDEEWEKLEKVPAWNLAKVRSKKEVMDEARTKGAKSSFCLTGGHPVI